MKSRCGALGSEDGGKLVRAHDTITIRENLVILPNSPSMCANRKERGVGQESISVINGGVELKQSSNAVSSRSSVLR